MLSKPSHSSSCADGSTSTVGSTLHRSSVMPAMLASRLACSGHYALSVMFGCTLGSAGRFG